MQNAPAAPAPKEDFNTCMLRKLKALSPPARADPAKHLPFMQWCNACLHFKLIPNAEVQDQLETLRKAPWVCGEVKEAQKAKKKKYLMPYSILQTKKHWIDTAERWRLEELEKAFVILEGDLCGSLHYAERPYPYFCVSFRNRR